MTCTRATPVLRFNPQVASDLVYQSRRAHQYDHALEDYEALRAIGIDYAYMENQAALCVDTMKDGDLELGLRAITRACELMPSDQILAANAMLLHYRRGGAKAASPLLKVVLSLGADYEPSAPYAYVALGDCTRPAAERLLTTAISHVTEARYPRHNAELRGQLDSLRSQPADEPGTSTGVPTA